MYPDCFPKHGHVVLDKLKNTVASERFILAGGTALALQIGHRISEDLDFFTEKTFSTDKVFQKIKRAGLVPAILQEEEGTLVLTVNDTKISFFHYAYPFIEEKTPFRGIHLANVIDIASMKVIAISQRGAKRDFIDLYFILRSIPFWKIAENMTARFGKDRINPVNIGKSLVYFNDAEEDPEPRYSGKTKPEWKAVKKFFTGHVRQMVLDMEAGRR